MSIDFDDITTHDQSDDCVACRAQDIVGYSLVPAVATWEESYQLPRHALAVHGAAGLMAYMIQSGAGRDEVERAVAKVLDDYEAQAADDGLLNVPPQGTA